MFWENSESVPYALRGRTFLAVLSHLKTLDLPDYCPIISRIKFWWFSFFLNLKTDLRKPRYQFFLRRTFAPKNLGGGTATFDFLRSDLFAIVYLVFLRICVCVSVFVFVFVFVFLSFFCICLSNHLLLLSLPSCRWWLSRIWTGWVKTQPLLFKMNLTSETGIWAYFSYFSTVFLYISAMQN